MCLLAADGARWLTEAAIRKRGDWWHIRHIVAEKNLKRLLSIIRVRVRRLHFLAFTATFEDTVNKPVSPGFNLGACIHTAVIKPGRLVALRRHQYIVFSDEQRRHALSSRRFTVKPGATYASSYFPVLSFACLSFVSLSPSFFSNLCHIFCTTASPRLSHRFLSHTLVPERVTAPCWSGCASAAEKEERMRRSGGAELLEKCHLITTTSVSH